MDTYWDTKLTKDEIETCAHLLNDIMQKQGSVLAHFGDIESVRESLPALVNDCAVRVLRSLEDNHVLGVIVWGVANFWWSKEPFLFEDLVLAVDPKYHGFAREAIKALEVLAKANKCKGILSGCLLQDKPQMVLNSYRKFGFNEIIPNMLKVCK